jgi:hypothetical protein
MSNCFIFTFSQAYLYCLSIIKLIYWGKKDGWFDKKNMEMCKFLATVVGKAHNPATYSGQLYHQEVASRTHWLRIASQ